MNAHDVPGPGEDRGGAGEERHRRLVSLLAAAGPDGSGAHDGAGRARLGRVCAFTVSEAGVDGAGITVMAGPGGVGARDQVSATGPRTRLLEDLQLTTGEGPGWDAYWWGAPVLVGDLDTANGRWPGYGPEAFAGGTAAVFSLPLQVGAVRLGTLDLNRDTAGPLSAAQLADALVLAGLATETLLELADHPDAVPGIPGDGRAPTGSAVDDAASGRDDGAASWAGDAGWLPGVHAEVHQASGMVSVRAGVTVAEALLLIRAHAFASGVSIGDVARRIVDRELLLDGDDP